MSDTISLLQLLKRDPRYPIEAYTFVGDGLSYATTKLKLGSQKRQQDRGKAVAGENHLTGQELCEALRIYAQEQYGYMAKSVLNSWGIHSTSDFGNIVYNLIDAGMMKKSEKDQREHFDDVYEFQDALVDQYKITSKA